MPTDDTSYSQILCMLDANFVYVVKNISVLVLPLKNLMPLLKGDMCVLTSSPYNSVAYQNLRLTGYMIKSQLFTIMLKPLHNLFPAYDSRFIFIPPCQTLSKPARPKGLKFPKCLLLPQSPSHLFHIVASVILQCDYFYSLSLLRWKNLEIKESCLLPKYLQHCV